MAKKATPKALSDSPVLPNLSGPSEFREVTKTEELVSKFTLDDGSVLHIRPLLLEIKRSLDQYNAEGDPLYFLKIGFVVNARVPVELKKKTKKKKK